MSEASQDLASEVERRIRKALGSTVTDAIVVTVRGDRVALHGLVNCWTAHQVAERAAAATPGVAAVDNELTLSVRGTLAS
jgi:osmotically-inducible protein OsmY